MDDDHDLRAAQASLNRLIERQKIDDGNLGFGDVRVVKVPIMASGYRDLNDPVIVPVKVMTLEEVEAFYGRRP